MPRLLDGLPVDNGASDCMDSSRLAGMMAMANLPNAPDCSKYCIRSDFFPEDNRVAIRHTNDPYQPLSMDPRAFSRDQSLCLFAGLMAQGQTKLLQILVAGIASRGNTAQNWMEDDGSRKRFGGDWFHPGQMGAIQSAAKFRSELSTRQHVALVTEIVLNAIFSPIREPNQLITTCYMAGPKYLRLYKRLTPKWREALRLYWGPNESGYNRDEEEFVEEFILWLEQV